MVRQVTTLAGARKAGVVGVGLAGGVGGGRGGRSVASKPTCRHSIGSGSSSSSGGGSSPGITNNDKFRAGVGEPAAATAAGPLVDVKADGSSSGGGGGGRGGGTGGQRSSYLGSRPAMALGQAAQGQQGGGVTSTILALVNRTERGQRLRALNWVKQVRTMILLVLLLYVVLCLVA